MKKIILSLMLLCFIGVSSVKAQVSVVVRTPRARVVVARPLLPVVVVRPVRPIVAARPIAVVRPLPIVRRRVLFY